MPSGVSYLSRQNDGTKVYSFGGMLGMKHIYTFLCLFLLSGVANADKWLCGTAKSKTYYFICGTYPNAHPDDWFRQYIYILDEATKNEDRSGRVSTAA